jgi:hypothetical protein
MAPARISACRAPTASHSHPSAGAPSAPASELVIDSAATTRPRIAKLVSSCTRAATVVSMSTAPAAMGRMTAAKAHTPPVNPDSSWSALVTRPAKISVR